jgi:hypothetical protein
LQSIQSKKPGSYRQWVSKCTMTSVDFNEIHGDSEIFSFAADDFKVKGIFPSRAAG